MLPCAYGSEKENERALSYKKEVVQRAKRAMPDRRLKKPRDCGHPTGGRPMPGGEAGSRVNEGRG